VDGVTALESTPATGPVLATLRVREHYQRVATRDFGATRVAPSIS